MIRKYHERSVFRHSWLRFMGKISYIMISLNRERKKWNFVCRKYSCRMTWLNRNIFYSMRRIYFVNFVWVLKMKEIPKKSIPNLFVHFLFTCLHFGHANAKWNKIISILQIFVQKKKNFFFYRLHFYVRDNVNHPQVYFYVFFFWN